MGSLGTPGEDPGREAGTCTTSECSSQSTCGGDLAFSRAGKRSPREAACASLPMETHFGDRARWRWEPGHC